MFAWTSHGTELKRFGRQPITRAAIAVMLLIPLLYGAMYVWAFWDPTVRMNDLPVALVNADVAKTDADGNLQHYGTDVVDELIDDDSVGWTKLDAATAAAGVESGKYYFAVTIPKDFTTDILSLGKDDPTAAKIMVSYDDSNSFLASTLGRTAMMQVREAVAREGQQGSRRHPPRRGRGRKGRLRQGLRRRLHPRRRPEGRRRRCRPPERRSPRPRRRRSATRRRHQQAHRR